MKIRIVIPNFRTPSTKEFLFSCLDVGALILAINYSVVLGLAAYLTIAIINAIHLFQNREFVPNMQDDITLGQIASSLTFGLCWPFVFLCSIIGLVFHLTRSQENV